MVKRSKLKRNAEKVWGWIVKGVSFVWRQTIVYNIILGVGVALLFAWLLSHAFSEYFSCRYLIQNSLNMPSFMCNGYHFKFAGVSVVNIPGLSSVIDEPLEWIRQGILWIVLFFGIVISGYATFIIYNMKKVTRLLAFNKQEWEALFSTMRIFITILFLFLISFLLLIKLYK